MQMEMFELVCVRGKEVFGLSLWAKDTKEALAKARAMVRESGYAVHPAPSERSERPKVQPEVAQSLPLAA
jgi:hypothetical protein